MKDVVVDTIAQMPGSTSVSHAASILTDLPWLLADAVAGTAEPPNPTEGPILEILRAETVPASTHKVYIAVSVSVDGETKFQYVGRTPSLAGRKPQWSMQLHLGEEAHAWGAKTRLRFLMLEEHTLGKARTTAYVANVVVSLKDLKSAGGRSELLLEDIDGDPLIAPVGATHTSHLEPCFLECGFQGEDECGRDIEAHPARLLVDPCLSTRVEKPLVVTSEGSSPAPAPPDPPRDLAGDVPVSLEAVGAQIESKRFARHVFMMSRGTRGDVQPFVALARGLCSQLGWLVTICTESRWRDFVLSKCSDISDGEVRFACSGGDTQLQTESWISQEFMNSKTEALQELLLAASEANFFASAPVFMRHLQKMADDDTTSPPVDLIINSFTLTGVALMCGEALHIPVVSFCLQPSCIPSDDKGWHAIVPVNNGESLSSKLQAVFFTSHGSLKPVRNFFNRNPWAGLSLPMLRKQYGLQDSKTWKACFKWGLPIVIPMMPGTFVRPSDWPSSFVCTDFIFLRSSAPGGGQLSSEVATFVGDARASGRKLMVMTFSSMPVPRAAWLSAAVEMLSKSKHDFSLLYVGKTQPDRVPADVLSAANGLKEQGKLLEVERADFGVLFRHMDAFVVHGGLGTTVEALRMRKPVAVTGILLMDQRFWGVVCHQKGVGPPPVHIEGFKAIATDWADRALDPTSDYALAAAELPMGDEAEDGVTQNVQQFARLLNSGLKPPKSHLYEPTDSERETSISHSVPHNA